MTTKDLILQAAQCLFNQEGFEATSARQIARIVRISQGNLRYHYATKEAIAEQLIEQFYRDYRAILKPLSVDVERVGIGILLDTYRKLFDLYHEYRFIFQDLWSLIRRLTGVKDMLQKDYLDRQALFCRILETLVKTGQLEDADNPSIFRRIINLQIFVGDSWIPHCGLYGKDNLHEESRHYLEHWISILLPYLTVSGLEALMEYSRAHRDLFCHEFNQLIQFYFDRKPDLENLITD